MRFLLCVWPTPKGFGDAFGENTGEMLNWLNRRNLTTGRPLSLDMTIILLTRIVRAKFAREVSAIDFLTVARPWFSGRTSLSVEQEAKRKKTKESAIAHGGNWVLFAKMGCALFPDPSQRPLAEVTGCGGSFPMQRDALRHDSSFNRAANPTMARPVGRLALVPTSTKITMAFLRLRNWGTITSGRISAVATATGSRVCHNHAAPPCSFTATVSAGCVGNKGHDRTSFGFGEGTRRYTAIEPPGTFPVESAAAERWRRKSAPRSLAGVFQFPDRLFRRRAA